MPGPTKALPGLDLSKIFTEGFKARNTEADRWHKEDPGDYHYHASSLSGCSRAAVLTRAGFATDGNTVESLLTFEVGHCYHRLLEEMCFEYEKVEPRFKVLAVEAGGSHPVLPLKARCDLLFSWEDELILCDLKTEAPLSRDRRRQDQTKYGYPFPYRLEHQIQVAAQAIVIEALMKLPDPGIAQGRILYVNKVNMVADQVPVAIDGEARYAVMQQLERRHMDWEAYVAKGLLPNKLSAKDETWRCRARSEANPKGLYCQSRSYCMSCES